MKFIFYLLLALALVVPEILAVEDGEVVAANLANFWASKARQHRAIKMRQRQHLMRRRRISIPPWIAYKEDTKSESDKKDDNTETPNADGKKPVELEDTELWSVVDLNRDGKLTLNEFERFYRSPNAQAYVRQMKARKAVEDWAAKMGMDVEKARMAMNAGVMAERQQNLVNRQNWARMQAFRRRQAIARRNQQINLARQQQQNYWARIGRNQLYRQQQYYRQMQRRGGRTEL